MKFKAFEAEWQHAEQLQRALDPVGLRRYVIETIPASDADGQPERRIEIDVRVTPYQQHTGISLHVHDAYLGGHELADLTSKQLARIALVRAVVEQWIEGILDELPTMIPGLEG